MSLNDPLGVEVNNHLSVCEASEALKSGEKVLTLKSIKMTKVLARGLCTRRLISLLWKKVFHFFIKEPQTCQHNEFQIRPLLASYDGALSVHRHHYRQFSDLVQFPGDWFLNSIEQNSMKHQELNVDIIRMMITPRQIAAPNITFNDSRNNHNVSHLMNPFGWSLKCKISL